uniref:Uncharacterized protein n=1 Tax=Panagrolaimus davidi TaxID=227884 RepID=A0A914PHU4_9BILA
MGILLSCYVDYQLGLIRNADIFNPLPSTTNQPVEAVSSDPKLAPHPSPLMEERSTTSSSVIWCNNLFITDEMDTNHEMESDETQSLTSYTSFDGNYSIA